MNSYRRSPQNDATALHLQGRAALAAGHIDDAIAYFQRAMAESASPEIAKDMGNAWLQKNDTAACREAYELALRIDPCHIGALNNLALLERLLGQLPTAERLLRQAVAHAPHDSEVWTNLGVVRFEQRDAAESEQLHRKAVELNPDNAQAWLNLAIALEAQGARSVAASAVTEALTRVPELASARIWSGRLLRDLGRKAEALAVARAGVPFAAGDPVQLSDLGTILMSCGDLVEATRCFERAVALKPDHVDALINNAIAYNEAGRSDDARPLAAAACRIEPDTAENWMTLASTHLAVGDLEETARLQKIALALRPEASMLHSNVLYTLHYLDTITPTEIFLAHKDFGLSIERFPKQPHVNDPNQSRTLRIGYVSGDFCDHSVAYFFEPLLAGHNRRFFSIHLFATHWRQDGVTDRLRKHADYWHECWTLDDYHLAKLISENGIDVLVDLSGHTAMNRLPVFAQRPAPLQISWLGYPGTTGLTTIDLCLSDETLDPVIDIAPPYSERVVYLPQFCCYRPPDENIAIGALPLSRNGFATLGAFHSLTKMSQTALGLWTQLLLACPNSRLKIIAKGAGQNVIQQRLYDSFEARGIDPSRIDIIGTISFNDYLEAHNTVDLIVDSLPWNGHTTTCHALWMGVPTLTLRGNRRAARMGAALQGPLGLDDFIAETSADFVEKGKHVITTQNRLAGLRQTLRSTLLASRLTDGKAFASDMESLYRREWHAWCAKQLPQ